MTTDHAAHGGHATPVDAHAEHAADHDKHAGHSVAMFRDRFWISLLLTIPVVVGAERSPGVAGVHGADLPGSVGVAIFGTVVFLYGGLVFLRGGVGRAARSPARNDDAHLARHQRGLGLQLGGDVGRLGSRTLSGNWSPHRRHAARTLVGNAQCAAGLGSARRTGQALAGHGRTTPAGRNDRASASRPAAMPATWCLRGPERACPPTAPSSRAQADVDESMITGESTPVRKGARRRGSSPAR